MRLHLRPLDFSQSIISLIEVECNSVSHIRVRDWCREMRKVFNYPLSTFETRYVERIWQGAYQTTTINVRQPCCFTQLLILSRVSAFLKIIKQWLIIISFMDVIWLKYYKSSKVYKFIIPMKRLGDFFVLFCFVSNNEISSSKGYLASHF